MASYEAVEPEEGVEGRRIWTATILRSENHDGFPTLYVLTADELHFYQFVDDSDQAEAADAFAAGTEPEEVICTDQVVIPLADITRVERLSGQDWFYVQADRDGGKKWSCVYAPDALGLTIFRALKKRLKGRLRAAEEKRGVLGVLGQPIGCLVVVGIVTLMIWAGARSAQDNPQAGQTRPVTSGGKAADGAKFLGEWLGPNGALVLGGVLALPVLVWGMLAVANRPMKKVLRPRTAADRDRDRDDAEDTEEAEEVVARPRGTGKKAGGPRAKGKGARRGTSPKVRVPGIAAIVLGVAAAALGWVTSLQVVMLLVAVVGLGVGVFGVLAAWAQHGRGQSLPMAGSAASALGLVVVVAAMMFPKGKSGGDTAGGTPPEQPVTPNTPNPVTPNPPNTGTPNAGTPPAAGATMADWGEPSDPDGDCPIAIKNGALVIDVPATPHGLVEGVGQGNAPRVMREVEGDFSVTVKVAGTLHPTAAGTAPKALSFQAGGLLVWDNKDNYARFVRSGQNRDGTFNPVVAWSVRAGGKKGINPQAVDVPEQDVYLHLERRGKTLSASYSLDGQKWVPLQTFQGLIGSRVSVGVVALNAAQQPMSVRFEGLRFGK